MPPKRQANFELLRITAMLMVITMHYLINADLLPVLSGPLTGPILLGTAIESLCIAAVNVYVLMSGFFMVRSEFRFNRLFKLLAQILFYTILIPPVLTLMGLSTLAGQEGIYGILKYIFPIATGHYWFATAYILLCLLCPFLNLACTQMTRKQTGLLLLLLLTAFSFIKSFVPLALATDRFGYDFGWFTCLYLIGAYLKLHGLPILEKGKRGLLLYIASAAGIFVLILGIYGIYQNTGLLDYYFEVPFHYNYILCLTAALGLFFTFSKITIKEGRAAQLIRTLGPLTFGVYLLHMHLDLRDRWYAWTDRLLAALLKLGLPGLVIKITATVLLVFAAGVAVDYIRSNLFKLLLKHINSRKPGSA